MFLALTFTHRLHLISLASLLSFMPPSAPLLFSYILVIVLTRGLLDLI